MTPKTQRLDVLLVERGLCLSREQAQGSILAGEVWSLERRLDKPGVKVDSALPLEIRSRATPFVSRAGQKLEHGLDQFQIDTTGRTCLDIGASTGGFTDCMLKRGAAHVFAVDVGYGQLDSKLRADSRVTVVEKTNARFLTLAGLEALSPKAREISLLTMDVSFISLCKIIEPMFETFRFVRYWLLLFKPQFEVGREHVGKGGLVRDDGAVHQAMEAFDSFMKGLGFELKGAPESSPLSGKKSGNLEYLVFYESHSN